MDNAVLVSYSVSKWNNVRTDKQVTREIALKHGVNSKAGRYQKKLIDSPLYKAITDAGQYGRDKFYAYTLPWQQGTSIVNIKALDVLNDEIAKAETLFADSVDAFINAWPTLVENARETLGPLFKQEDYPSEAEVRSKFGITFTVAPIAKDSHFDGIAEVVGSEVAKELAEKLTKQQTEQWQKATKSVWIRLYDALKHAHDKLAFGKRIYDSDLGNLQELTDLLPVLNVSDDPALDERRRELNSLLQTYSTHAVKDKSTRSQCASDVNTILNKIRF